MRRSTRWCVWHVRSVAAFCRFLCLFTRVHASTAASSLLLSLLASSFIENVKLNETDGGGMNTDVTILFRLPSASSRLLLTLLPLPLPLPSLFLSLDLSHPSLPLRRTQLLCPLSTNASALTPQIIYASRDLQRVTLVQHCARMEQEFNRRTRKVAINSRARGRTNKNNNKTAMEIGQSKLMGIILLSSHAMLQRWTGRRTLSKKRKIKTKKIKIRKKKLK